MMEAGCSLSSPTFQTPLPTGSLSLSPLFGFNRPWLHYNGIVEIVTIYTGVNNEARFPNSRAYVGFIYFIPNVGIIVGINTVPWSDKAVLLVGQSLTGGFFCCSLIGSHLQTSESGF